ncbi:hypothetical protein E1A91_D08G173700v1 [Gossypium mustelinum]|uniref:Uncharacterized protein n=1 Tax=Gossypium mustelinum TaxID=34275 RepID=A0A5D2TWW5_GOSMU|nr:hypothetical protein E1A91_D08G173700v1 [Gossypium mustelinum]
MHSYATTSMVLWGWIAANAVASMPEILSNFDLKEIFITRKGMSNLLFYSYCMI